MNLAIHAVAAARATRRIYADFASVNRAESPNIHFLVLDNGTKDPGNYAGIRVTMSARATKRSSFLA